MRLYARHDYDADPAEVFTMLTDEAFLREKLEARGDTEVRVLECGPGAGGFRIVTRRTVALDVPGFARRVLRPTNKVTQTDVWSDADAAGTRTGTWQVEASGVPVTMTGTTGKTAAVPGEVTRYLDAVRAASKLPVCAGFGIRAREQVRQLDGHVSGVIVGSALVEVLESGQDAAAFLRALRPA